MTFRKCRHLSWARALAYVYLFYSLIYLLSLHIRRTRSCTIICIVASSEYSAGRRNCLWTNMVKHFVTFMLCSVILNLSRSILHDKLVGSNSGVNSTTLSRDRKFLSCSKWICNNLATLHNLSRHFLQLMEPLEEGGSQLFDCNSQNAAGRLRDGGGTSSCFRSHVSQYNIGPDDPLELWRSDELFEEGDWITVGLMWIRGTFIRISKRSDECPTKSH